MWEESAWSILISTLLFSGGTEENDESHQNVKRFWGLLSNIEHYVNRRTIVNPLDHDIQQYWKKSLTDTEFSHLQRVPWQYQVSLSN